MTIRQRKRGWRINPFYFVWGFYSLVEGFLNLSEIPYTPAYEATVSVLHTVAEYITIAMLLLMLISMNRYTKNRLIAYLAFAVFIFFVELQIAQKAFLIQVLFIMCFAQKNFDNFVRFDIKIKLFVSTVLFTLCALGVLNNYVHVTDFAEKQSLGFSHPNVMSAYIQAILIEWLYLRYEKMKWYEWAANIGIWLVIYLLASSRTTAYTYFVIYLLFVLARVAPRLIYAKAFQYVFTGIMPAVAALSFLGVFLYDQGNSAVVALNMFMSNRLMWWSSLIQTYGVSLFGQEIALMAGRTAKLLSLKGAPLDNAYYYCLLRYGLLYFILLCSMYVYVIYYAMRKKKIQIALVCVYYAVIGLGESYMMNPIFNIMLLCLLRVKGTSFGGVKTTEENDLAANGPAEKKNVGYG